MNLEYKPVTSRYVRALAYDPETQTLGAIFHEGSEYHYANVPIWVYEQVILAPSSVGGEFDKYVKRGGYEYTKVR
jgi:hypothetical protein